MTLLSNRRENNIRNLNSESNNYVPIAILQANQLENFARGSLNGLRPLYEELYKNTGSMSFTKREKDTRMCRSKPGVDLYLAALEALLIGITGMGGIGTLDLLDYGKDVFFNEDGYVVSCEKVPPLYERRFSKNSQGKLEKSAGIVQINYRSPIGNYMIKQNQINNRLFELYFSKDMSEVLYKRLSRALEIALDFEEHVAENIFIDENKINLIDDGHNEKQRWLK